MLVHVVDDQDLEIGAPQSAVLGREGAFIFVVFVVELVAGDRNTVNGVTASAFGGSLNVASGDSAAVTGGFLNEASGFLASVSGGTLNRATGDFSAVAGG